MAVIIQMVLKNVWCWELLEIACGRNLKTGVLVYRLEVYVSRRSLGVEGEGRVAAF